MFVDIHTHNEHSDNQQIICIYNYNVMQKARDMNAYVPCFFSVGIHPWEAQEFNNSDLTFLYDFIKNNNAIAVGESGLDRVYKETYEKQREVFLEMIKISEELRKPLIIHAVRSFPDIISIKKHVKPLMPWIIHGFQGSVESARQLLAHGIYISLGEMIYRNDNQAVKILDVIPVERLFFETDVSGRSIIEVYERAAFLMNYELDYLEKNIYNNFKRIFGDGKMEEQNTYFDW